MPAAPTRPESRPAAAINRFRHNQPYPSKAFRRTACAIPHAFGESVPGLVERRVKKDYSAVWCSPRNEQPQQEKWENDHFDKPARCERRTSRLLQMGQHRSK